MKFFILILGLAGMVYSQCPTPIQCGKGMRACAGRKTGSCPPPRICIPERTHGGKCANSCPIYCGEGQVKCSNPPPSFGCPSPDFCHYGDHCPVNCNSNQRLVNHFVTISRRFVVKILFEFVRKCTAPRDPNTGKQLGSDTCIPRDIMGPKGKKCPNHCPAKCTAGQKACTGGRSHYTGCRKPDRCIPDKGKWISNNLKMGHFASRKKRCIHFSYLDFCPANCQKDQVITNYSIFERTSGTLVSCRFHFSILIIYSVEKMPWEVWKW